MDAAGEVPRMRVSDFQSKCSPLPLKFPLKDTPHITIETNRTCNLHCKSCYTLNKSHVKKVADIKAEIDLALSKRKADTITLLGGEPTLHPDLMEIIRYIKRKKVKCQLLTNGLIFLEDEDDIFMDVLKRSGVDRILLHIDEGQSHVYRDISKVRHRQFSKFEMQKIHFSLSMTISNENKCRIPALIAEYSRYRFFDGILAVLARNPIPPYERNTELIAEYSSIRHDLHLEPVAYIPFSLDDRDVSWLIYYYYINARTKRTFCLLPVVQQGIRKIYKWIHQRERFAVISPPRFHALACFLVGIVSIIRHPFMLNTFFKVFDRSSFGKKIRFQYIAIQTPPKYDTEKNQYSICYHCPDATIRNGVLTPVCVADQVNPFKEDIGEREIDKDLRQTIYSHLDEIPDFK